MSYKPIDGQLSLFDFLPKDVKPGEWVTADRCGAEVLFYDAAERIGDLFIIEMPRQSAIDYKVVKIEKFLPDMENVYWYNGEKYIPYPTKNSRIIAYDGHRQRCLFNDNWFANNRVCPPVGYAYRFYEVI